MFGMSSGLIMGGPASLFSVGGSTSSSNLTTYTFGTTSLGAKINGKRWTIVCAGAYSDSNGTLSSISVDGSAANLIVSSPSDRVKCGIAIIDSSAMSDTVSVDFTLSASQFSGGIYIYRAFDIDPTPYSFLTTGSAAGLSILDTDVTYPSCTVGVTVTRNGGGSFTWTGLSEDYDVDYDSNDLFSTASGGSIGFPSTIRAQNSGSPSEARACVVSWR